MKTYNKLVRDKIPGIIRESGAKCTYRVLSQGDYLKALDEKLTEEFAEYHRDQSLEELADLLEVIYAAAKARGCSAEGLERIREEKAAKRGRFDEKIMLLSVED
jgi:predicted house-cleaning noncanonical NTP pyrophosphatase (MazG superfamily)